MKAFESTSTHPGTLARTLFGALLVASGACNAILGHEPRALAPSAEDAAVMPDAALRDAGPRDAGELDAGMPDAQAPDATMPGPCDASDNLGCPASTQCRTPAGQPGLCYPRDCGSMPGLCLAVNADGSGEASSELLTEPNRSFDFRAPNRPNNNWNGKARYFAYLGQVQGWDHICVFPEVDYGGTPLVIPLGQARSTPTMFGASNAGPDHANCP